PSAPPLAWVPQSIRASRTCRITRWRRSVLDSEPVEQCELHLAPRRERARDSAEGRRGHRLVADEERRVIEEVRGIHAQLNFVALVNLRGLDQTEIEGGVPRSAQDALLERADCPGRGCREELSGKGRSAGDGGLAAAVERR